MTKADERVVFERDVRNALAVIAAQRTAVAPWLEFMELLEGERNYEDRLMEFEEIAALDSEHVVDWRRPLWAQLAEEFPTEQRVLERAAEYFIEVLEDSEQGSAMLGRLLAQNPQNLTGLRLLVSDGHDGSRTLPDAETAMRTVLEKDPAFAVFHGLFDYFDDLDQFVQFVPAAIAAIDANPKPSGYERGLKEQLRALLK